MYKYITNRAEAISFPADLQNQDIICLDIETTGLNCFTDQILLLQVKTGEVSYLFDWRKCGIQLMRYIVALIKDSHKITIGHNIRFDAEFIAWNTGEFLEDLYDTMLMEILLNAGVGEKFYSLADLAQKYLNIELDKSVRNSFINYEGEITQEQLDYASKDIFYLEKIREDQLHLLHLAGMKKVAELENKLITVMVAARIHGIKLNEEKWKALKEKALADAEILLKKLNNKVFDDILEKFKFKNALELCEKFAIGIKTKRERTALETIVDLELFRDYFVKTLNPRSPNQMVEVCNSLYDLDVEDTNAKTLAKKEHWFIDQLEEYRELRKSASSFGDNYTDVINPQTGRIHTTINQLGADTGRTSSEKPSLQNMKGEESYREAFEAEEGWELADVDYSQQEYRITGSLSKEPAIIEAYKNGMDMHTTTAMSVFQIPAEKVTKPLRNRAKTYNFAIIYGANKWGLAYSLNIKVEEAEEILNRFYDGYPVLKKRKESLVKLIKKNLFSVTMYGRRRYFKRQVFFTDNYEQYKYNRKLEKEGFNHAIQGTGADIVKLALCKIYYENPFGINKNFKILLLVHDEILCEVRQEIAEEATEFIKKCMLEVEQPFLGEIPAAVSGGHGKVWKHE